MDIIESVDSIRTRVLTLWEDRPGEIGGNIGKKHPIIRILYHRSF